jgi:hypothetical protein
MRYGPVRLNKLTAEKIRAMSNHISKSDSEYLSESIANAVRANKQLEGTSAHIMDTPHPHYDYRSRSIIVSTKDPTKFLSELSHASGHTNNSLPRVELSRLARTSRTLARALSVATVPTSVIIAGNKFLSADQKIRALDILAGASTAAVIPAIVSDMEGASFALRHSSNKLKTLVESSGNVAGSVAKNLTGPLGFFAARRVLNSYNKSENGSTNIIDSIAEKVKGLLN